jgi:hypothetical protein
MEVVAADQRMLVSDNNISHNIELIKFKNYSEVKYLKHASNEKQC